MGMMNELVQYFSTRGDVAAVYRLPDAHRHPSAGPASFDLGVLFHPLVDGSRYEELRLIIAEEIAVDLNRADIRLVTLNDVSPSLGYDLTQRGGPIYCGSEERLAEFENRVQIEFLRTIHDGRVDRSASETGVV